jgi:hypothetical protein
MTVRLQNGPMLLKTLPPLLRDLARPKQRCGRRPVEGDVKWISSTFRRLSDSSRGYNALFNTTSENCLVLRE